MRFHKTILRLITLTYIFQNYAIFIISIKKGIMKKIILFLLFFCAFKSSQAQQTSITVFKPNDTSKVIITNKDYILKYDIGSDWTKDSKTGTMIIPISFFSNGDFPLIFADSKKITYDEMMKINRSTIKSMNILYPTDTATIKYGDEGKNGVVLIN